MIFPHHFWIKIILIPTRHPAPCSDLLFFFLFKITNAGGKKSLSARTWSSTHKNYANLCRKVIYKYICKHLAISGKDLHMSFYSATCTCRIGCIFNIIVQVYQEIDCFYEMAKNTKCSEEELPLVSKWQKTKYQFAIKVAPDSEILISKPCLHLSPNLFLDIFN